MGITLCMNTGSTCPLRRSIKCNFVCDGNRVKGMGLHSPPSPELVVLGVFVFPWGLEHPGVFLPEGLLTQGCFQVAYTVTRPYAGFRHPDRMAPDQTVRGRENGCSIQPGNLRPKVPKFSVITGNFRRFSWAKNEEHAHGRIDLTSSGFQILSSSPRPRLTSVRASKIFKD